MSDAAQANLPAERTRIAVSRSDWTAFLAALEHPPAPNAALRLNVTQPRPDEAWLGFGPAPGAAANLSPTGDLREAARNLFAMLHQLDGVASRIAVAPIPRHGLGEAINDRLKRAAAPRS